jgi:hypothetical protein
MGEIGREFAGDIAASDDSEQIAKYQSITLTPHGVRFRGPCEPNEKPGQRTEVLRGWVRYFAFGHSSRCFS